MRERVMTTIRDLGWWYWVMTVGLLGAGLQGWAAGVPLAMVFCAVQIAHVTWLTRDVTSFPVQVRVAYLGLLLAGLWGPLQWVHWVQLVGTSARVVVGYCFLARVLSLASWNRRQPISWELLARTFCSGQTVTPPCSVVFQRLWLERMHI
jgi:hypothetical protein